MARSDRRTLAFTLLVSLGLHALLLSAVASRWALAPAEPTSREPPLEFVLIERGPPVAPAARAAEPPSSKPRPPQPARRTPVEAAQAPVPPAPAAPDRPVAQESRGPSGLPAHLLPTLTLQTGQLGPTGQAEPGRGGVTGPSITRRPRGLSAPSVAPSVDVLIKDAVAQARAVDRVRSGHLPTYFVELRKLLVVAWDVSSVRERRGARPGPSRRVVRLVQDREGALVHIELVAASADEDMDSALLSDFVRVARSLPPPPPEAIGERTHVTSVWEFEYDPSAEAVVRGISVSFDVVTLVDSRAIPPPSPKRVKLLALP